MVVVGGGITGLATAWFLKDRAGVTVVEASDRLGGKIGTLDLAGISVEAGPDTFLARLPHATDLCRAVGLGDDLVAPATGKAFMWARGRLRPLPTGVLGVPTDLLSLIRSGVLAPAGVLRAAADLVMPRQVWGDDPSLAEVVGGRMGAQALDRLVEPLVGGINAGTADNLSLASTAPQLAAAAARHRSLILGVRRERRQAPPPAGPVFLGISGGMERLVARLAEQLETAGVTVLTDARADRLDVVPQTEPPRSRYCIRLGPPTDAGGSTGVTDSPLTLGSSGPEGSRPASLEAAAGLLDADSVVLTAPAFAAAPLLRSTCPAVADDLERIAYASVALVTFAYPLGAFPQLPTGAGFLVPRAEGRLMTACTFTSSKWLGTGADRGLFVLRASAGRVGDDRIAGLDDEELTTRLHLELAAALGIRSRPVASVVARWPRAFPQYAPGHQARVERMEATLAEAMPGVLLAGAAYRGLGLASCIRQAQSTATAALAPRAP